MLSGVASAQRVVIEGADAAAAAVAIDSSKLMPVSRHAVTDVVKYKAADSIAINIVDRQAFLYGKGDVTYQNMNLKADEVKMDFNQQIMQAYCVVDPKTGDKPGRPLFKQGETEYLADTIRFNYNTSRGVITSVITQEEDGFLHGDRVKKVNDSIMYLTSGKYTTCNYEHPHYSINFTKAKLIAGDKMLSGPAMLHIENVPTPLMLPFAFFPLKNGRASGLIIPTYGWMDSRGYYLQNGGYYWAINKNVDLTLLANLYTNMSYGLEAKSNYYFRYKCKGNVDLSYGNTVEGLKGDPNTYNQYTDFKIVWSHQQDAKANPYQQFSANVTLQSRNYNRNTINRNDYFNRTTTSNITYTANLGTLFTLNASARESFNAQTGLMNIQLPVITLNSKTLYPFRRKSVTGSYCWYENISLTYSMNAENNVSTQDSDLFKPQTLDKLKYGVKHSVPISSTVKVFKYINWTNSLSLNERWHWRTIEKTYDTATASVLIDTINGFRSNFDGSFTSSLSTRIYGMFNFKYGFIKALRHVINPSVGLSFRPDFGASHLGYWKSYTDNTGYVHRYSIFEQTLYNGPSDGMSGCVNISIGNNLEIKVANLHDSLAAPTKVTLLESFTIATGYDLAKDSLNWSDLSVSGRTTLFKCLVLNYSASFSPYVIDDQGRIFNRFLYNETGHLFRRNSSNYSAQLSYSFNNNTFKKKDAKTKPSGNVLYPILQSPYSYNPALLNGTYVDFSVPWNLSLNYSVTYVNSYVAAQMNYQKNFTQTLSFSGNFQITPKWKFAFSSGYDFVNKGISYTSVDIYRDLHCWEMRFNWVPFGYYKSWNFVISIKAATLKDMKYEKNHSYLDNQGYYTY